MWPWWTGCGVGFGGGVSLEVGFEVKNPMPRLCLLVDQT